MLSPTPDAMSRDEMRAGASLASIFGLRMLGLFLILPVFAVHAQTIPGGDNLTLVGIALGAYGLTQSMFQIPFGMAADHFGRKKVIILGLLLFAFGSAVAVELGPEADHGDESGRSQRAQVEPTGESHRPANPSKRPAGAQRQSPE